MAKRSGGRKKAAKRAPAKKSKARKPARRAPARKRASGAQASGRLAALAAENRRLREEIASLRSRLDEQAGAVPAFNLAAEEPEPAPETY
jgi:hypothetical protein